MAEREVRKTIIEVDLGEGWIYVTAITCFTWWLLS